MYVPSHFAMTTEQIADLLTTVGAGDLITHSPDAGLQATRVPFSYDPSVGEFGQLRTHLSKVNPQWRDEGDCLVVLHGPEHYISPAIVPSAAGSDTAVPTWNYVVVHAHGRLVASRDESDKLASLRELVAAHEDLWSFADVSPDHLARMLPALVDVRIEITRLDGKAKMSQNQSSADLGGMIEALAASGHGAETAEFMRLVSVPHAKAKEALVEQARRTTQRTEATPELNNR